MPKRLNVELGFTADTSQAKKQIADLQKSLDSLMSSSIKNGALNGFDKDISKAQQSVLKLKTAINNSLNADTGRLDLSKFNTQLNNSGLSLSKLATDMRAMGTDGQKAFLNLANSIVTAQKPMAETNKLLDGMWTALKNTARWQLSSSLLHGFMGAIQGAYNYAQNLDESLTNIAIVTGRSRDEMAQFAEQANKSAQALSASTTAYTDAALIYYQQGLGDAEVQERTDATIKLANVTGQSAEQISSYMTAIWNNFEDGAHSIEYYADVITSLGAHTASSSEEIARGMQQFASVADTVGLSYEYAASALATIVAQTRQSESSVGNGLRTVFARLDSLKMGETLEDGVGLTKYTEALQKAGVNVLDQNGKLKDMNTILDAIGEKWQALDQTQKAALATTVGGVRQYSNLMALFDNWDQFQENVAIAQGSEGSLEGQAEIYAESWEAAQKRVRAAWQAIYQDLIDSDFFISILNGAELALKGIDGLIDALGGIPGVLSGIGVLVSTLFEKQMVASIQKAQEQLKYFKMPFSSGPNVAEATSEAMSLWVQQSAQSFLKPEGDTGEMTSEQLGLEFSRQRLALVQSLKGVYEELGPIQKELADEMLKTVEAQQQQTLSAKEALEIAKQEQEVAMRKARNVGLEKGNEGLKKAITSFSGEETLLDKGIKDILNTETPTAATQAYDELYQKLIDLTDGSDRAKDAVSNLMNVTLEAAKKQKEYSNSLQVSQHGVINFNKNLEELIKKHEEGSVSTKELIDAIESEQVSLVREQGEIAKTTDRYKELEVIKQKLQQSNQGVFGPNFAQSFVNTVRGISELTMGINSLKSAWDTIRNPDISGWQKVTSVITSLSFGLPMFIKGFKELGGFKTILSGLQGAWSALTLTIKAGTLVKAEDTLLEKQNTLAKLKNAQASLIKQEIDLGQGPITAAMNVQRMIENAQTELNTALTNRNTAAKAMNKAVMWEMYIIIGLIVAAIALWNKEEKDKIQGWKDQDQSIQDTTESAKKLINAYDELKNKLDELQGKRKALKDLEKGTEEYEAAVAALNAEMLELIKLYGLVEGKDFNFVNGVIEFTEEGNKAMTSQAKEQRQTGYVRQMAAATTPDSSGARANEEIQKIISKSIKGIDASNQKEFSDAYLKLIDPTSIKALSQIDLTKEGQVSELLGQLGITGDIQTAFVDLITSNGDLRGAIEQLSGSMQENTAAQAAIKAGIYDRFGSDLDNLSADYLTEKTQELYNENYDKMGKITEEDYVRAGYKKNSDNEWEDENGVVQTLTDEMIRSQLAYLDALNQLDAQYKDNLDGLTEEARKHAQEEVSNKFGEAFGSRGTFEAGGLNEEELSVALSTDLSQFDTVTEAIDYIKKACEEQHYLELNVNADDLSNYKGKTEDLEVEVQELSDFIQKNTDKFRNLSEHMADCDAVADKFAYSLIRFDDALQDVSENYEDWSKTLKASEKDILKTEKATKELRKTYANLLDMDGSKLSEDFLQNADNLDLMNEVLTGTEEEAIAAYDQLAKIAAMDIAKGQAIEMGVKFDEESFNSVWDTVMSEIDALRLEAGQPIDMGEARYDNLVAGLNQMLALVGNDVDAAKALFAQMGFTAEFENQPVQTEDEQEQTPVTAQWTKNESPGFRGVTAKKTSEGGLEMSAAAGAVTAVAYDLGYTPGKAQKAKGKKVTNVGSLKIKDGSLHYIGGGSPKITNMPTRNLGSGGGGGGGSCFAAGTSIALNNYYKNIEDIKVGDIVLSYNEKTKKNEYSKVVQTMIHNVYEKIYDLFIKNDKLVVTGNHRFLITRNNEQKWIQAADIQLGDYVLLADGTLYKISKINIQTRFLTVYNFEVSNTHNYYVGENQVLAHNKGGGGGGSQKKKEVKEKPKDEDRYHDIKERIADLNTELKRLDKNKDRAFGKSKLKYMDQEIEKIEKEIDLTKEYIGEIERYLDIDKKALDDINMGAKFNLDGMLTNYEEVLKNISETYGAAIDAYNDSAQEDADKEALAAAQKKYEEDKKILAQYEKTYNLLQEQNQELIDQINDLYDKKLEKIQFQVELELEFDEEDRKLLEWLFENIGDSADYAADKIANLNKQLATLEHDYDSASQGLVDLFANHGIALDFENLDPDEIVAQLQSYMKDNNLASELTEKEAKSIREWTSTLLDSYSEMKKISEQVHQTVLDTMDDWVDRIEFISQKYDILSDTLEHYRDIIDLTGKRALKMTSQELNQLNQMIVKTSKDRLSTAKLMYDTLAEQTEEARKQMEYFYSQGLTNEGDAWKEIYEDWLEKARDAFDEYQSAWQEALDANQEAFERALDEMVKDYNDSFGKIGLDWLTEQFERQGELDELYLPDYKKFHELNKSTNELEKSLKNTNNALIKGKMGDLLDEINAKMASGAQVSEYETEIIARRVALLQAEAELENAKNAKNAVRMTRDNEGNFSYTYTADSDAIDAAQQNYGDKFYELLDYERQTQNEIQSLMLQKEQEHIDAIADAYKKYGDDRERLAEALKKIDEDYLQWREYLGTQEAMILGQMARLRDEDWQDFERIQNLKLASREDFITGWEDTIIGRLEPMYESAESFLENWMLAEQTALEDSSVAHENWQMNLEDIMINAGTSVEDFRIKVENDLGLVADESEETRKAIENMVDNEENGMKKKLQEAIEAARNFDDKYGGYMKSIQDHAARTRAALDEVLKKLNETYAAQIKVAEQAKRTAAELAAANQAAENLANQTGGSDNSGGGKNSNSGGPNPASLIDSESRRRTSVGYGGGHSMGYTGFTFASGGYTGDWHTTEGKVAMLHQKELVLNEDDTKNILSVVDLVRQMINPNAATINNTINYSPLAATGAGELQQQVHIEASFPNVQSHSEIELALNNLINSASQYVNRKS